MVGAVVVRGGEIVGEGFHESYGGAHAEVLALRAAGERTKGATLYVSLEPCNHAGKTPPCTEAILAAGIARVVVATPDPHPKAAGGARRLREAGIDVEVGLEQAAARELNAPFFHALESDRPWVVLKLALSIDGALADAARERGVARRWITGEAARREVHHMRAGADAIAVGIGTVLADDPRLTVRDVPPPRVPPRRVVFDSALRIPLASELVRTARDNPTLVIAQRDDRARREALVAAGVEVWVMDSLTTALVALRNTEVRNLLVEGGERLAASLLEEGVVDRLVIFQAPVVLGAGALYAFSHVSPSTAAVLERLPVIERQTVGDDLMTTYALGGV
jgi:diaminohydroxyphosphoribosylaminopyrimidine deaminase/5-amino-6-(5-phosphoribosylamino)uracil reductase